MHKGRCGRTCEDLSPLDKVGQDDAAAAAVFKIMVMRTLLNQLDTTAALISFEYNVAAAEPSDSWWTRSMVSLRPEPRHFASFIPQLPAASAQVSIFSVCRRSNLRDMERDVPILQIQRVPRYSVRAAAFWRDQSKTNRYSKTWMDVRANKPRPRRILSFHILSY